MKALHIDPVAMQVLEVDINPDDLLTDLYRLIGCRQVQGVFPAPDVMIYVDEDGGLKSRQSGFTYTGLSFPVHGAAVVVGPLTDDGSDTAVAVSVAAVSAAIRWVP